jgi:hypothetical protein
MIAGDVKYRFVIDMKRRFAAARFKGSLATRFVWRLTCQAGLSKLLPTVIRGIGAGL